MRIQMSLFITLLLVTVSAQAEPRAVCDLARVQADPADSKYVLRHHQVQDQALKFTEIDNTTAQAHWEMSFESAPGLNIALTIEEKLVDGKVDWTTTVKSRTNSDSKVVAEGWTKDDDYGLRHLFKSGDSDFILSCGFYDRMSDPETDETASERGRLRTQYLGGEPLLRGYRKAELADLYDFSNFVANLKGRQGELLRHLISEVLGQGYQKFYGSWHIGDNAEASTEACKTPPPPGQTCQRMNLLLKYFQTRSLREKHYNTAIEVRIDILRDSNSGVISDVRIQDFSLSFWPGGLEGTASTSGGRLK